MKKYVETLKEYVRRLNDEELKFIGTRLSQRLGGDLGEAVEYVQAYPDVDRCFAATNNAREFYDMVDQLEYTVQQESKKRFSTKR